MIANGSASDVSQTNPTVKYDVNVLWSHTCWDDSQTMCYIVYIVFFVTLFVVLRHCALFGDVLLLFTSRNLFTNLLVVYLEINF